MNLKKLKIIFGVIVLIFLYLNFSSPNKIVVDRNGNISGLINKFRENIQGNRFWNKQLKIATSDLKWALNEPNRQAKLDQIMEDMYQKLPNSRPSNAEIQAQRLRKIADKIEYHEFDREIELIRQKTIKEKLKNN